MWWYIAGFLSLLGWFFTLGSGIAILNALDKSDRGGIITILLLGVFFLYASKKAREKV